MMDCAQPAWMLVDKASYFVDHMNPWFHLDSKRPTWTGRDRQRPFVVLASSAARFLRLPSPAGLLSALYADTDPSWLWKAGKYVDRPQVNRVCATAKMLPIYVRLDLIRATVPHHVNMIVSVELCKRRIFKFLVMWCNGVDQIHTFRKAIAAKCCHQLVRYWNHAPAQSYWPATATARSNWSTSSIDTNWNRFGRLSANELQRNIQQWCQSIISRTQSTAIAYP